MFNPPINMTPRSEAALRSAREMARRMRHSSVTPEHIFLCVLELDGSVAANAMRILSADVDCISNKLKSMLTPSTGCEPAVPVPLSDQTRNILLLGRKWQHELGHDYFGTEQWLLGILSEGRCVAAQVLMSHGLNVEITKSAILKALDPQLQTPPSGIQSIKSPPNALPMKLGIINSAFQQVGMDTVTGLEHIKRIGFDTVDIFTEAMGISPEEVTRVAQTCERLELPVISLPVVSVGLIDFNEPVRQFHVQRTRAFIDLAKTWNARNVLLVLGEYIWQREVIPPEAQWQWGIETCRELGDYADSKGIDIALELEPFRLSLLNSVDSMVRFIDECNHPRVRANIDISHLVLSDTSPRDVAKLKGRAIHVHLSDCDGKVHGDLPPGRGVVKFEPYLQAIKELQMDGVISIELEYSPDPGRIVEWVEEAYRETAGLMELTGLRS